MSKVQGKNADLLDNLTGAGIASELDSHLRDLEKNIAVAREFIKLADESYSELRHKWNLLHEEARSKSQSYAPEPAIFADKKAETRPRNKKHAKAKDTELTTLDEPESRSSADISPQPETHVQRSKNSSRAKKEQGITNEDTDSAGPEKPSQPYRDPGRRRGKNGGRN